jgi:8-oxo-dGTP diphosphatase
MTKTEYKMIDVVCALIIKAGKLLIVQHGPFSHHPGKWEFPGGKMQPGESPEEALIREIREELAMEIQIITPLEPASYAYPDKTILLIPFLCSCSSADLILHEHSRFEWVDLEDLAGYDLLPADNALLGIEENSGALMRYMNLSNCYR